MHACAACMHWAWPGHGAAPGAHEGARAATELELPRTIFTLSARTALVTAFQSFAYLPVAWFRARRGRGYTTQN